jgi:hypothetical protein
MNGAINPPTPSPALKTTVRARRSPPTQLGFLLDELRRAGVTTYANLASALNRQVIRPQRGRWSAHDLNLLMRRHRRAHPAAAESVGGRLFHRRAEEARRVMRRLKRRGLSTQSMVARALNARGLTTPGLGRAWTARSVSRVLANTKVRRGRRKPKAKLH